MRALAELRELLRLQDFRKLFSVRLVSQAADGVFQVGLATLFFFSPENATTATGVASAFAVLLLPFTIVGPWAGVFLDRWRRRQVLVVGNVVRVAITLVIAAILLIDGVGPVVYVLALLALSVNRFLLAALSAALPRVVSGQLLLTANSLTPTLGAAVSFVGAGVAFVVGLLLPDGRVKDASILAASAGLMAMASALATRMTRDQLGPDTRTARPPLQSELGVLARGLVAGARHLIDRRTPARGLAVMAIHRFLYGATFIAMILISRNLLADPADARAGLETFGTVLAASAVGFVLAVILTPVLSPATGPHGWIVLCLSLAAVSQLLLTVTVARAAVLVGVLMLGLAAQGAKIAVDTIVQRDTADEFRGRAFALYDVLYNGAFVAAAALAAVTLPDTGYQRWVFAAISVTYVATAAAYRAVSPRVVGRVTRAVGSPTT